MSLLAHSAKRIATSNRTKLVETRKDYQALLEQNQKLKLDNRQKGIMAVYELGVAVIQRNMLRFRDSNFGYEDR